MPLLVEATLARLHTVSCCLSVYSTTATTTTTLGLYFTHHLFLHLRLYFMHPSGYYIRWVGIQHNGDNCTKLSYARCWINVFVEAATDNVSVMSQPLAVSLHLPGKHVPVNMQTSMLTSKKTALALNGLFISRETCLVSCTQLCTFILLTDIKSVV